MRHLVSPIITTTTTMSLSSFSSDPPPSSSSTTTFPKPKKLPQPNPNCSSTTTACKHCPSATLDILILILVLFSGTFLLTSYFSYLFNSLSLLFPPIDELAALLHDSPTAYVSAFFVVFVTVFLTIEFCCGYRKRKCGRKGCKGLKNALEFDLQLQSEECLKQVGGGKDQEKDLIDKLPWKGETEVDPDYECLRSELRKMAPVNGRAVLLFRNKCGCAVAKLEGWGSKRRRRHKKSLALKGV